jgi:hypothetical protein
MLQPPSTFSTVVFLSAARKDLTGIDPLFALPLSQVESKCWLGGGGGGAAPPPPPPQVRVILVSS